MWLRRWARRKKCSKQVCLQVIDPDQRQPARKGQRFGSLNRDALHRLKPLAQTAPVRCVQVLDATERAGAAEHVRDPQGHLQGACHVFGHAWALVRPDAYVAATGESIDAALVHAVARALGATETTA